MPDIDKVIKGLEWILEDDRFGFGVNWENGDPRDDHEKAGKIITDVLILLKEQEAVSIMTDYFDGFGNRTSHCPSCNSRLVWHQNKNYCGECGQAVKWE